MVAFLLIIMILTYEGTMIIHPQIHTHTHTVLGLGPLFAELETGSVCGFAEGVLSGYM